MAQERPAKVNGPVFADNLDLRTLQATERQSAATELSNIYAGGALTIAALQLLLTIVATIYILRSFRHTKSALLQGEETLRRGQVNLQRQLRLYVHVFDVRIVQLEIGKPIKVELKFTNTGQSPAVETQIARIIALGSTKDPIALRLPNEYWSIYVVGTNEVRHTSTETTWNLSKEKFDSLMVPEHLYILLHGAVTYTDTFGQPYITTFSLRSHDGSKAAPINMQGRPWGNRMDHPDDIEKWMSVRRRWTSHTTRVGDLEIPK